MQQRMLVVVLGVSMLLGGLTIAMMKDLPDSPVDGNGMDMQTAETYSGRELRQAVFDTSLSGYTDDFGLQWERDYGTLSWWSAGYEVPQPIGDADNDGNNELLI